METKGKIIATRIFKLALISSVLLFFSVFYWQKLWSELWLIYGFIQIGIIIFFLLTTIRGLIFWIKKDREYRAAFVPFVITATFFCLIIVFPLNKIRNRLEFATNKTRFETAADVVLSSNVKKMRYPTLYKLPKNYQDLSAGGGEVLLFNNLNSRGVLFYTFRGVPGGMSGFFKIEGGGRIEDFKSDLAYGSDGLRNLGDNWYFISGE
jgi:hypothetical protein